MSEGDSEPQANPVAALNDAFRCACVPFVTPGVMFLPDFERLIQAVRDYDDFTTDNDPYGEHDFGAFNWADERVHWKIDYRDPATGYFEDPLSPDCERVLTILTSDEY